MLNACNKTCVIFQNKEKTHLCKIHFIALKNIKLKTCWGLVCKTVKAFFYINLFWRKLSFYWYNIFFFNSVLIFILNCVKTRNRKIRPVAKITNKIWGFFFVRVCVLYFFHRKTVFLVIIFTKRKLWYFSKPFTKSAVYLWAE